MPLPVLVTFVIVLSLVFGSYWLFVARGELAEQTALRKRLKGGRVRTATPDGAGLVRADQPLSTIAALDRVLRALGTLVHPAQQLINKAGVTMNVGTLIVLSGMIALAAFLVIWYLTDSRLLATAVGCVAAMGPTFGLRMKANRRIARFEEQFPEAIDLMSRALRAGHAFTTALSLVGEEMPEPVGSEFKLAFDRQNFGMPLPDALRSLGERVPLLDARFFVTAVLTQREVGGNLSEVLENLSGVIRERFRVKRQVRVITAHSRMTAWVLALMPPALALVLTLISPQQMRVLWTDPTGIRMIVVALMLQAIGTFIISRLVNIDY